MNQVTKKLKQEALDAFDKVLVKIILVLFLLILAFAELILYQIYLNPRVTSKAQRDFYYYSQSLKDNPESIESYLALAEAYYKLKDTAKAVKTLETAEKVKPTDYRPTFEKGRILYEGKDLKGAKIAFESAAKKTEESVFVYFYLGKIAFEEKRYHLASYYLHRAIEIDTTLADVHLLLAQVYEKLEMPAAAITEYREVLKYLPDNKIAIEALKKLEKEKPDGK